MQYVFWLSVLTIALAGVLFGVALWRVDRHNPVDQDECVELDADELCGDPNCPWCKPRSSDDWVNP